MTMHWFLVDHMGYEIEGIVSGTSDTGKAFSEYTKDKALFLRGFTTALNVLGHTYEFRSV